MLETFKDFLAHFTGRKETLGQTRPLPAATKKPAPTTDSPQTTLSDNASATIDSHPVNAQDPNAVSTPGLFSHVHDCVVNFNQIINGGGAGEAVFCTF